MCRRIRRFHATCQHWHIFWPIECKKLEAKKEKREQQKQGFWSKLMSSKLTCKTTLIEQNTYGLCPFCTRGQNLDYASDEYGEDLVLNVPNSKEVDPVGPEGGNLNRKFREELLRGGPTYQDSTMRSMPSNMRNCFLNLSSSEVSGSQLPVPPQIHSKEIEPGIDFERWKHTRDHILPPRSGPPPDKPLPPIPSTSPKPPRHDVHDQLIAASLEREKQGRRRDTNKQRITRKPVAQRTEGSHLVQSRRQVDGPAEKISPAPRTQTGLEKTPLPLILDKDRELPDILPWIPSPESPSLLQKALLNDQPDLSREGEERTHGTPESPLTLNISPPSPRYVNGPGRRAKTLNSGHEHIHSVYADIGYISPIFERRIDDVVEYWMSGGRGSPEADTQMPQGSQTEPSQYNVDGNRKPSSGKKVQFDDHVRDVVRHGANPTGRDLIRASTARGYHPRKW